MATKEHLNELEKKYGITIMRNKSYNPVPRACKQYGVPFLSKRVSMYISRLQNHGFQWEDQPFEELLEKYPKCKSALMWWCNKHGDKSMFNINKQYGLKEFMVLNPPTFKISDKCCDYAKKKTIKQILSSHPSPILNCVGVRKREGGVRSMIYKTCFSPSNGDGVDSYRPLFFFTDEDKQEYEREFGVCHSKCYTEYGLHRTGCAGCPFNSRFEEELEVIKEHEPKLYKAVCNIFGDSYAYTRMYRKFKQELKQSKRGQ